METVTGRDRSTSRPALGLPTKLSYGFGSVAIGVSGAGLSGAMLQIYLNQVLGLPALLVGATIMVSLMVDAVIDPLIGQWSDKARSRWGRRHPFMYASALPVAALLYLLWNAPHGLSSSALVVFTLGMMIAVRLAISFYIIPSNALTPELTPDYDQRTTLQSYRWFFGIIGGATITFVLNEVFLRTSAQNPLGILNRHGYAQFGLLAAAVTFASILISTAGTHNQIPYLPQAAWRAPIGLAATLREIRITLTNRSLVALMLGGILGGIGGGIGGGLSIYLYTHFWGLDPGQFGLLIPLGSVGSIIAVFIAPYLSRRLGKKTAVIGLFSVSVVTAAGPLFLRLTNLMVMNGSPWLTPILIADGMVTATVSVVGYILVGSMMADVVEDVAVKTGVRSEGLLFATNGLLPKFTGGIGAFIAGVLLTVVHFPPHALKGSVSPELMRHLAMIYLPVTAFFSIVSIAVLGFYKIDRTTHERNLESLREAAASAEANQGVEAIESGDVPAPVSRVY
jgi:glycoside/pentoside/hexuronide:cation symporter, GPH family